MSDDSPPSEASTAPPITPEQEKAARIARGRANLLPPCKPGETRNRAGVNGRTKAAALIRWLEEPSDTDPDRSRIKRIWQACYLAAIGKSAIDRKVLIEQHAGKPKQQIDLANADGGPLRVLALLPDNGRGPNDPKDPDDGEPGPSAP